MNRVHAGHFELINNIRWDGDIVLGFGGIKLLLEFLEAIFSEFSDTLCNTCFLLCISVLDK